MSERTGNKLLHVTRRQMLKMTGATIALGVLSAAGINTPEGHKAVEAALQAAEPLYKGTPLEVLIPTDNFSSCQAYKNSCVYDMPDSRPNLVVGFGDSNMRGTHERYPATEPTSILTYLEDLAKERYSASWITKNYAIPGYRTDQIIDDQILRPGIVEYLWRLNRPFDVWVNAGGNDFRIIMETEPARAALIEEFSRQPISDKTIQNKDKLLEIAQEGYQVLQKVHDSFYHLLESIVGVYGKNTTLNKKNLLQHIVVVTFPDMSKTPKVDSSEINKRVYEFAMDHPWVKAVAKGISIYHNNQTTGAIDRFMEQHPETPIVAINTFDLTKEYFGEDEHFNDKGKLLIAQRQLDRSVFV